MRLTRKIGSVEHNPAYWFCLLLAEEGGFSARCIAYEIWQQFGQRWALSDIYNSLREAGIRLRDFRDGETKQARKALRQLISRKRKIIAA